jgi:hypothetical protein
MKTLRLLALGCGLGALAATRAAAAAAPKSDLVSPQRRLQTVETAARLTKAPPPFQIPADLPQPFNPAGFDAPDPEEARANAAAGIKPPAGAQPVAAPAGPTTDRDLLEAMAPRIQPTGSLVVEGRAPILTFPGAKRARVGDVLQVQFNEKEYDIEIVGIDRTNFTLRYRGEELTRPIKPIK